MSQGPPAKGGISSFASMLVDDPVLRERYELELVNTTREGGGRGGTLTFTHARDAIIDTVRTFRSGRQADIVHIQTTVLPVGAFLRMVAMTTAARAAGARVLVHVHSARINTGRAEVYAPSPTWRRLFGLLGLAHEILTVSDAGADLLRPLVRRTPVHRFDNAVDASLFAPRPLDAPVDRDDPTTATDATPPADERPVILYVGTLSRRKGLFDLARALERLDARGVRQWRLQVVGGADEIGESEAAELTAMLVDAGLGDALLGALGRDAVAGLLAAADVFVLPSSAEGQPIAVLEAMACGVPVIGTTVGAMPDVVREGVDGLLIEPHDVEALTEALARLLGDQGLRRKMGTNARRRIEDGYDLDALRERVTALYDVHLVAATR